MAIRFNITNRDGRARTGIITTGHGMVHTPTVTVNFTPALLRTGLTPQQVQALGTELLLVNTLHGHLGEYGDVHKFLNWDGPVVADSGGYQMISLAKKIQIKKDGVEFTIDQPTPPATDLASPLIQNDTSVARKTIKMTPEKVLDIQRGMVIDMMMPLDYVVDVRKHNPFQFLSAVWQTEKWFRQAYKTGHENLFYIVQGGTSSVARSLSLWFARKWLNHGGVQAVALGGISLGESPAAIHATVDYCCKRLPENKPRHLLGVGRPIDLVRGVLAGIDTFDCVTITREARHGRLWTDAGMLRLTQEQFVADERAIEMGCDCPACLALVSRSKLRAGLRSADEAEKQQTKILLMQHNIRYVMRLIETMRREIESENMQSWTSKWLNNYKSGELKS